MHDFICRVWNPTGEAIAAQYWENESGKGFSPVCKNKFNKGAGCRIGKGFKKPCQDCIAKSFQPLTVDIIQEHIAGKQRYGIYPLLRDDTTPWIAADMDAHSDEQDPASDVRKLIEKAQALDIPLFVFSSNSGAGFHPYIFFKKPIPAYKARAAMHGLLDRAGIDITERTDKGSFDRLFPNQDSLNGLNVGNNIALPYSGSAVEQRGATLLLSHDTLEPVEKNIEENISWFSDDFQFMTESDIDGLLSEMGIDAKKETRRGPGRPKKKKPDDWVNEMLFGVDKGGRNEAAAQLAGYYLNFFSGDIEQTTIALDGWNQRNRPPLNQRELKGVIDSIASRRGREAFSDQARADIQKIEILHYPDGDKKYRLHTKNEYVILEPKDLISNRNFRLKMLSVSDYVMTPTKDKDWVPHINQLLEEAEKIYVDNEETDLPILWGLIKDGVSSSSKSEKPVCELIDGSAVRHDNKIMFRLNWLRRGMEYSMLRNINMKETTEYLRRMGFKNQMIFFPDRKEKNKTPLVRVWEIEETKANDILEQI